MLLFCCLVVCIGVIYLSLIVLVLPLELTFDTIRTNFDLFVLLWFVTCNCLSWSSATCVIDWCCL